MKQSYLGPQVINMLEERLAKKRRSRHVTVQGDHLITLSNVRPSTVMFCGSYVVQPSNRLTPRRGQQPTDKETERAVPEIAMHSCCLLRFRKMQRQPLNESLHGWNNVSFHSSILLCPGINLLLDVITCNKGTETLSGKRTHTKRFHKRYKKGTC